MSSHTLPSRPRVGVIGCGVFGAMIAIRLREGGYPAIVFERDATILNGASCNNQNRLHLGFHYPRDIKTALQCFRGFERFVAEFGECVVGNFANAYFIAEKESRTTPEAYLAFCDACGLDYTLIDPARFDVGVQGVSLGIRTEEPVYDLGVFRSLVLARLERAGVDLLIGWDIASIERRTSGYRLTRTTGEVQDVDVIVNCGYADVNRLTAMLGHSVAPRQYDYTAIPIIRWRRAPVGVTIMDGPFCSVLPHGRTGNFLLYHVERSVLSRATAPFPDPDWLNPDRSPFAVWDRVRGFEQTRDLAEAFIPSIRDAECVGYLRGPRVVLANSGDTDERPSIVQWHDETYLTVFSGKIDHCMCVGDDVLAHLDGRGGHSRQFASA